MNDDTLARSFSKYPTFLKAKVIRDKYTKKTKGYGFVSFKDPHDFMQAMREMNGEYVIKIISASDYHRTISGHVTFSQSDALKSVL